MSQLATATATASTTTAPDLQDQFGAHPQSRSSRRRIEELDQTILRLSKKMNADCYQMLVLIREFDERAGWLKWSLGSCSDWLHWRCDLSRSAAREKVRVAHAIKVLPRISEAFSRGNLSYSKVRALTRVAAPDTESALIEMARVMTAAHVEQHCRQRQYASAESLSGAARAQTRRAFRSWRNEHRGTVVISIELPMDDGLLFERAIDKASADQAGAGRAPPDDSTSWQALQADAAVAMARAYLDGDADQAGGAGSRSADHYQVMVHVDLEALTGNEGQSEMPIDTVKRLCCDGSVVPVIENDSGEPLNVGRRQRVVGTALRRALWSRDRGCAFPGCSHTRFVDAHHIRHWAQGGETRLDNLVLLCTAHHKLMHEGGYSLTCNRDSERVLRVFRRPDGRVVPACGYHSDDWQADYSASDHADDSAEGFTASEFTASEFTASRRTVSGLTAREPPALYQLTDVSARCALPAAAAGGSACAHASLAGVRRAEVRRRAGRFRDDDPAPRLAG